MSHGTRSFIVCRNGSGALHPLTAAAAPTAAPTKAAAPLARAGSDGGRGASGINAGRDWLWGSMLGGGGLSSGRGSHWHQDFLSLAAFLDSSVYSW